MHAAHRNFEIVKNFVSKAIGLKELFIKMLSNIYMKKYAIFKYSLLPLLLLVIIGVMLAELTNKRGQIEELESLNLSLTQQLEIAAHQGKLSEPRLLTRTTDASFLQDIEISDNSDLKPRRVIQLHGVLNTTIDGDFEGWEGETIFKMMDGSVWQQSSYSYTYHYSYMPDVLIFIKNGAYHMKVEDVDEIIQVERIN